MNNGASGVPGIDPAEVIRINMERALGSTPFASADRLRRFLRYVVEKSLSGQPEGLREYSIGIEVYGRKPDFDPRVDAIVRMKAGRLRGKLCEYYDSAGRTDPIRIELRKGSYTPLSSARRNQSPKTASLLTLEAVRLMQNRPPGVTGGVLPPPGYSSWLAP